jgi:copper transport protein
MPRPIVAPRRVWAAVLLVSFAAVTTAPARLHTALRRSEPANEARLGTPPTRIALWFTARPQLPFSHVRLAGATGDVALDKLVADTGNGIVARIAGPMPDGAYTVHWQTGSADGHPIRGEFTFSVAVGGPAADAPDAHAAHAQLPPSQRPAEAANLDGSTSRAVRWMEFVALLTVLGALGFRHGVLPPLAARGVSTADAADRARRLGQSVLVLYAIAALMRLYDTSRAMHGADALSPAVLASHIGGTTWGIGWLLGALGAALVFAGWVISRRTVTIGTPLALTGAIGMVLSPAVSGHAASSRHFILSVSLDMTHVAAAGVWIGGLLLVLIAGIPAMRRLTDGNTDAAVSALVNSFHPLALFCAPLVVVAGIGTSWIRLGSLNALVSTPYGKNLLYKLIFVALVVVTGAYNAIRARKQLGTPQATRRFKVSAWFELFFAVIVLAVTAALVQDPVPSEMVAP